MVVLTMNWRGNEGWTLEKAQADENLWRYVHAWGEWAGDSGIAACDEEGLVLGACWSRLFPAETPGYGFVASDTPEIGLAVSGAARGQGLGSRLIDAHLQQLRAAGAPGVSLSVEDGNDRARALYASRGFVTVGRNGDADTMLLRWG